MTVIDQPTEAPAQPVVQPIDERSLDLEFDVAAISELSSRERSSFKPIYGMNKWWARRSSSVFRALLLGLSLPGGRSVLNEFYGNQQGHPNIAGKVILDPFMGGGTTIVEALRLGFKAVGYDLSPLAWFIVKTETSATDIAALNLAYERLSQHVAPIAEELYTTDCPCCGRDAHNLHTFWVKTIPPHTIGNEASVHLYRDAIVGKRRNAFEMPYLQVSCHHCETGLDIELERADLVCDDPAAFGGFDEERGRFWHFWDGVHAVHCPSCEASMTPDSLSLNHWRTKRIDVHAVICPGCEGLFNARSLESALTCPHCTQSFSPKDAPIQNDVQETLPRLAQRHGQPLPFQMYALEGFCPHCEAEGGSRKPRAKPGVTRPQHRHLLGYRFYKSPSSRDRATFEAAEQQWLAQSSVLPWPRESIQDYEKTNRLVIHGYRSWHELFNPRQLLLLGQILQFIQQEADPDLQEALVAAFLGTLEHQNMLNIYYAPYAQSAGAFGRHDYHPKSTICEGNAWGWSHGRGTFQRVFASIIEGKKYLSSPYDFDYRQPKPEKVYTQDSFAGSPVHTMQELIEGHGNILLKAADSAHLSDLPDGSVDDIVTDPPYADAVQYSELADFFYVWLRVALQHRYPDILGPQESPKIAEIVQNKRRNLSQDDFYQGLTAVFKECARVLKEHGRLVFTFHHSKQSQWIRLVTAIQAAGFELVAVYPVQSEGTKSGNLVFHSNKNSISFDIIHVCRKRVAAARGHTTWSTLRSLIKDNVIDHGRRILDQTDHGQRLLTADIENMVWSDGLTLYARYEAVTHEGHPLSSEALLELSAPLVSEIYEEFRMTADA